MPCPAASHQPRGKGCRYVTFRPRITSPIQKVEQKFGNRKEKAESSYDPFRKGSVFPFRRPSWYVMH